MQQKKTTTKRQTDNLNRIGVRKVGLPYESGGCYRYYMDDLLDILPKHIRRGDNVYNLTMKYLYDGCIAGYERADMPRKYAYISDGGSMITALYGLTMTLAERGMIKLAKKENQLNK